LENPNRFLGPPRTTEKKLVGVFLPFPKTGASPCAKGAAFVTVDAAARTPFIFKVERMIGVVVSKDVVGAGNYTCCTAGA